ncbi:388_t:CDS:2 [Scutellospora calospora]|uniref:388_t:CDS:1 n=1 Tax=Scutellospora calospora TaxID=85575 RepID=A0ACA9KTC2_9GLOM|nr:388_t:CDS:2 [Scutellospora calospora]
MIIYKDAISDKHDEFVSDAYPVKIIGDVILEVDCQLIVIKEGVDVDIGANPSAEEQEEALEDPTSQQVINVVHAFRLQETSFDKKSYTTYLKGYLKKLKEHVKKTSNKDENEMKEWEDKINKFSKKVLSNIKDYQFYVGENFDMEGIIGLLNYREDGMTPYLSFFKDGLMEEKVCYKLENNERCLV